jgi:GT2 family glycosyltransferase
VPLRVSSTWLRGAGVGYGVVVERRDDDLKLDASIENSTVDRTTELCQPSEEVTVVLITHNRADELPPVLDRLGALPEQPPVIIVDNGSEPPVPRSLLVGRPHWQLIRLPKNEGAAARNIGVATATTPYVAFNDDDTWWEPGSLDTAVRTLDEHPDVAVVNASIVVEPSGREDPVCVELRETPLHADGVPGHVLGSFLAGASVVRRSAFIGVGGFERRLLIGGEEELLAYNLRTDGWHLVHMPDAVIHHQASRTRDPHLRRRQGIRNHLWLIWLRRPLPSALRRTVSLLRRSPADRHTARAVIEAIGGAPWVLRERRPIPPDVEADQRLLDACQDRSAARRYVS